MGAPMMSVSVPRIVLFNLFSAQSLANAFCTVKVISSGVIRWTRMGLIHVSKIGFVNRFSKALRQLCQRYSSLVPRTVATSNHAFYLICKGNCCPIRELETDEHAALGGANPYSFRVCAFSYAQFHKRIASDVDKFSRSARNVVRHKRLPFLRVTRTGCAGRAPGLRDRCFSAPAMGRQVNPSTALRERTVLSTEFSTGVNKSISPPPETARMPENKGFHQFARLSRSVDSCTACPPGSGREPTHSRCRGHGPLPSRGRPVARK